MLIRVIESRVVDVGDEDSCTNDVRLVKVEVECFGGYDIFVPDRPGAVNSMYLCGCSLINVVT